MIRFLHTADWQFGMKAARLGDAADKVREARYDTIKRMLEEAASKGVDLVIVAGDIFEDNGVSEDVIRRAIDALRGASGLPIYILPGNHDPLTADSVYLRRSWTRNVPDNVTVLKSPEPIEVGNGDVILYPCPLKQKIAYSDPTAWIQNEEQDVIHIGVAHGDLDTGQIPERPIFPIDPDRATSAGLDYLALGHWHSLNRHTDGRTVYPGTPETSKFGERDSGHAVIVAIASPGTEPAIEVLDTGRYEWQEIEEELSSDEDLEAILRKVMEHGDPDSKLVRLVLRGAVPMELKDKAHDLPSEMDGLAFLELDDHRLHVRPDLDTLLPAMPGGATKDVVQTLMLLMSRHPHLGVTCEMDPEEAEGLLGELVDVGDVLDAGPEVLERAMEHLYVLSREVKG